MYIDRKKSADAKQQRFFLHHLYSKVNGQAKQPGNQDINQVVCNPGTENKSKQRCSKYHGTGDPAGYIALRIGDQLPLAKLSTILLFRFPVL